MIKQKNLLLPNLAFANFGLIIVFSTKVNLVYLLYLMVLKYCLLHLIKHNCLVKSLRILIMITQVTLKLHSPLSNLKLHTIPIIPQLIKKVMSDLDSPNASGPDCVSVIVLRGCEPERNLRVSCCQYCQKLSAVDPVFKNVGERSTAKNYYPAGPLSVVVRIFEKRVNNELVDHFKKCGLFLVFSMVSGYLI